MGNQGFVLNPAKMVAHQNKGNDPGPNQVLLIFHKGSGSEMSGSENGGKYVTAMSWAR